MPIRLYIYAGILIAIAGWAVYERYHLLHEGAATCHAEDQSAVLAKAQHDHQVDQDTIDGLNARIRTLEGATTAPGVPGSPPSAGSEPPPTLRVRVPAGRIPGDASTRGAQPGTVSNGGCDQRVPSGASGDTTVDLGPVVQDLALAGLLNRADGEGLWERAVRESQPPRR